MQQEQRSTLAIPVILLALGLFTFVSALEEPSQDYKPSNLDHDLDFDKRLYNFGLGKRAYSYVSEYKRLPVYNFGLGKRSPRYDFGLGKRNEIEEEDDGLDEDYEYEDNQYDEEDSREPESGFYSNESPLYEKRYYSSGYGKRLPKYDFGLGKRAAGKYDFGLGKKSQRFNFGLGKRERLYNFGLGKRNRMYNFGLGKRPASPSRYDFGLGKRSAELDSYLQKREVPASEIEENNSAEADYVHHRANVAEKQNETVEIDSHEIMGHSDRSNPLLAKRSTYSYDFGLGKRGNYHYSVGTGAFSRQFRRPLYNFGLGKRASVLNSDLAKLSYQT